MCERVQVCVYMYVCVRVGMGVVPYLLPTLPSKPTLQPIQMAYQTMSPMPMPTVSSTQGHGGAPMVGRNINISPQIYPMTTIPTLPPIGYTAVTEDMTRVSTKFDVYMTDIMNMLY